MESGCDAIFYPCLSYNFDEGLGDNHYNCPVVAYYPEVIANNVHALDDKKFIYDYIGIHRPRDFPKKIQAILAKYFPEIPLKEIKKAAKLAYAENDAFLAKVRAKGKEILATARSQGMPVIVLAGRPYHLTRKNHGIDELICDIGAAVISEDSVSDMVDPFLPPFSTIDLSRPDTPPPSL